MNERPDQDVMTNPRADRVRKVARLAGRSSRSRDGLFLAEGPQSSREALRAHLGMLGPRPDHDAGPVQAADRQLAGLDGYTQWIPGRVVESVYLSTRVADRDPELAELVRRAADRNVMVRWVTDEVLDALADAVTGQGIITVCHIPDTGAATVLAALPEPRLAAVLCRVQDPGNAGTILRAADASGAGAVVLTAGSVDVFNPKVVRSTAGSLFHVPVVTGVEAATAVGMLRDRGLAVLAADGYGSVVLDRPPSGLLAGPTAWLFGNEAQGLSANELALAAERVAVPLYGRAESLNVATAATVCLYASAMAQHAPNGASA
ncbi:RNA methyltransferase [Citricoccus zhacaiensis]|uniref:RNA methyltransferase n=1 Tax=Citricoccus zhacaiensis TaxID=489142 RepID=A0ABQ2LY70_9MICC|nr:RNA methyltransferase [Citricoccus zhacaiensis]GGO44505.1 RNA methyltransferase [Citricoccus zhacaiensis]